MQTIYIRNAREPTGCVSLRKVDACRPCCGLPGAVFKLFVWDENARLYRAHSTNLVTGDQGRLTVCNLRAGTYQFVEIMPPPGYQVNRQQNLVFEMAVASSGLVSAAGELVVRNWPCPPCPCCPNCCECRCCRCSGDLCEGRCDLRPPR